MWRDAQRAAAGGFVAAGNHRRRAARDGAVVQKDAHADGEHRVRNRIRPHRARRHWRIVS